MANDVRISDLIAPIYMPMHADIKVRGHKEYWLQGGRGSAKSSFISLEIILGLIRCPETHAIIYRKVAATLRESVYAQMEWAIDALKLSDWFSYRLSPLEIRYKPTGQRILFRGADDPGKSKSIKMTKGYFGFLWFEELAEFTGMKDIDTIKASIIRGGKDAITFYSYNPPISARNWVNEEALNVVKDRYTHASSYLDIPRAWLGDSFIALAEAKKASNERAYRHMYLGEVTGTGGQVFDNLCLRAISAEEISSLDRFYYGLDFGFAVDPDAFVQWGYDKRNQRIIAVDEYYGAHTPLDTLAEKVKVKAGRAPVYCDNADSRMIAELNRRGICAVTTKKGPGSREHGMRWLQDLGQIVIDPARTPNIAREFSAYEYRKDKNDNFLPDFPDGDDHTIDSTRYALESLIGQRSLQTFSKSALGL